MDNKGEHLDFGTIKFPIYDQLTIEALVFEPNFGTQPTMEHVYGPINLTSTNAQRNWDWNQGSFNVYNGNLKRSLGFPALPGNNQWVHIATTAGPSGLKIYYDGVLVASNSQTSNTNINSNNSTLTYGIGLYGVANGTVTGFDELKIWSTERSNSEISLSNTACYDSSAAGLLLFHDFKKLNKLNRTYFAKVGPNAIIKNQPTTFQSQTIRGDVCYDYQSKEFLHPISITVINNQPKIASSIDYTSNPGTCGPELIKVVAHATTGTITWYDSSIGGNIIGTGDTLIKTVDKDTVFYARPTNSTCNRAWAYVDIHAFPIINSVVTLDTICSGDDLSDAEPIFTMSAEGEFALWYENGIGGTGYDINNFPNNFTQKDTVYLTSGNEDGCESPTRTPVIINTTNPTLVSVTDTAMCVPGVATLHANGSGGLIEWWKGPILSQTLVATGSTFVTPLLDTTTIYNVGVNFKDNCYSNYIPVKVRVGEHPTKIDTVITCNSYQWRDGNTYQYSNSNYELTKPNIQGCDSSYILNLTVVGIEDKYVLPQTTSICTGASSNITIYGSQVGSKYSVKNITTNLILGSTITGNGSDLIFNTGTLTSLNKYVVLISKKDSIDATSLTCNKQLPDTITINVGTARSIQTFSTCGSYIWNGKTYTQSGNYSDTLTSVFGCDSISELHLTINNPVTYTEQINACGTYSWHGNTYSSSNNSATWTGVSSRGCDSTVTLDLKIFNGSTQTTTQQACDSYTWNSFTYTQSGMYTKTFQNINGCDSIVNLNLTIKNNTYSVDQQFACGTYTWINGATYTSSNNSATHTLVNVAGCDSVVSLNLTIKQATQSISNQTSCGTYNWHGNIYSQTGTYKDTILNTVGCDSITTLYLTISNGNDTTINTSACNSYQWQGTTYTSSGQYTSTLSCGALITLNLNINQSSSSNAVYNLCNPLTWIDGNTYTSSTTVPTYTLTNASGCDSVIHLNLTINTKPNIGVSSSGSTITSLANVSSYQWINCSNNAAITGATAKTYTATANGNYAVVVNNGNCSDTSACISIATVGLNQNILENSHFSVSPNPSNGVYNISTDVEHTLIVTNLMGQVIFSSKNPKGNHWLDLTSYSTGIYFLSINSEKGNKTIRLVKK